MKYVFSQGENLVKMARKVVEDKFFDKKRDIPEWFTKGFQENRGVFTTIRTSPESELRGCTGFPLPTQSLWKALIKSALQSAFSDNRFPPLSIHELEMVTFEVTILTTPERLIVRSPEEYINTIEIGKDGILIRFGVYSGILLPQVPLKEKWDVEAFLNAVCYKALLPLDSWRNLKTEIYRFQGKTFGEKYPRGEIVEHSELVNID
ncbi:MAG TPA: TIGR00296 family protein [Thermodesulfobacteriota bacterium]|nr:TIGR00296 family protein [Thermodesulfobacteriota bacterium]